MRGRKKKKLSAKMFTAITAPLLAALLVFSVLLSVITTGRFDLVLRDIFGEAGAEGFVLSYNRNEPGTRPPPPGPAAPAVGWSCPPPAGPGSGCWRRA